MKNIVVMGSFDDLRSRHVRFLEEASKLGEVHVLLWSDDTVQALTGKPPGFPQSERDYYVGAIRYVSRLSVVGGMVEPDTLPQVQGLRPDVWVVEEASDNAGKRAYCQAQGLAYHVVREQDVVRFPVARLGLERQEVEEHAGRKKVIVTGCYDWLHSGHVRFFEEVSGLGDVYVGVGSDRTVGSLKGPGHPMLSQDERRYMVQSIRYVTRAFVSSGQGWMDAEPEIAVIEPDIYAVNEDGDKPEKRIFCTGHRLQYVVLKRLPKEGLPRRQSTELRGF